MDVGVSEIGNAFLDQGRALHRQVDDSRPIHVEHDAPLQFRGGVVEVEDGIGCAVECLDRARDQLRPGLAEHLHGDLGRHHVALDDVPDEIEVRLRRGGESHLDLHEADFEQQLVKAQFLVHVHRIDQRLVAIAQIDAAPSGAAP